MATDPYATLGLTKDASDADIKSAYRKLAKQYHPDLNPDKKEAATKFREIGAAYGLLSDKEKRAAFDRGEIDMDGQPRQHQFYRDHAQGPQGQHYHYSNGGADATDFDSSDLNDIFSSLFGHRGGERSPFGEPDKDTHYRIEIDFIDAAKGGSKRVTMPDGRTLDIAIPEGIAEGQQLRLKGQGAKRGKVQGDAYVELHIRAHPTFTRQGNDIKSELPVGFHESILGAKVTADTIHGPVEVTIPKGASSGATLRLKGKGIKGGDQYVTLKIVMPGFIDDELEQAVFKWSQAHSYNPRQKEKA